MVNLRKPLGWLRAREAEFGFLPVLVAAIGMFVVSPVLSDSDSGSAVLNVLAFGVLISGFRATDVQGWPLRFLVSLGVFGFVMLVLQVLTDGAVFSSIRALSLMGLWVTTIAIVLVRVLGERRVTLNTVFGAVAAYFLIAMLCGFAYSAIEDIDAGSFAFPGPPQEDHTDELLYYSIVTQTTLGFGDITPIKAVPRTLAAVQAVIGQVYLVVLVARLVALQLVQAREADDPS